LKDQDASWFNLYRRQHIIRSESEYHELQNIFRQQGYKFDRKTQSFYKNEVPDLELRKLEKFKKPMIYDDQTDKMLTEAEVNELDEFRNCSLYPNTIIVEKEDERSNFEPVQVVEKKKRGRKLRLPLSDARRKEVLEIYDYRCSVCGYYSKSNQIHHVDNNPSNNQLENLVVYCYECHKKIHSREI
jgi:predicted restriction endonuclease